MAFGQRQERPPRAIGPTPGNCAHLIIPPGASRRSLNGERKPAGSFTFPVIYAPLATLPGRGGRRGRLEPK